MRVALSGGRSWLSAIQFLVLVQRALMEGRAIMEPLCTGDSIWPLLSVGQSGGKKIKKIKKKLISAPA
jgi:hypothetical protein